MVNNAQKPCEISWKNMRNLGGKCYSDCCHNYSHIINAYHYYYYSYHLTETLNINCNPNNNVTYCYYYKYFLILLGSFNINRKRWRTSQEKFEKVKGADEFT